MSGDHLQTKIHVLSRQDTQHWHSPFSSVLRDRRQADIVAACIRDTEAAGYNDYVIYDADETYLMSGVVKR